MNGYGSHGPLRNDLPSLNMVIKKQRQKLCSLDRGYNHAS